MSRHFHPFASLAALAVLSLPCLTAAAQQDVPPAPAEQPASPKPAAPTFPPPDPANFTASAPSKDTVNGFLKESWGYDENRVWQVQAIMKTAVDGISKVVIFIGDKTGKQKPQALQFYALPDGKHIIAGDEILTFGEHPYAEMRSAIQQKANGPFKGAATKDLELVEFADFQCPHCKEAQANMEKLATDFPKAHIVFENLPLKIHPSAKLAASYGVCVAKQGGNNAFFQYANAVFDAQDGLGTPDGATLTLNSAVTKAGLDPAKISACAATPATDQDVEASVKLAEDLNISSTPTLMINGRQIPVSSVPYETLKQIVTYQAKLDGVSAQ